MMFIEIFQAGLAALWLGDYLSGKRDRPQRRPPAPGPAATPVPAPVLTPAILTPFGPTEIQQIAQLSGEGLVFRQGPSLIAALASARARPIQLGANELAHAWELSLTRADLPPVLDIARRARAAGLTLLASLSTILFPIGRGIGLLIATADREMITRLTAPGGGFARIEIEPVLPVAKAPVAPETVGAPPSIAPDVAAQKADVLVPLGRHHVRKIPDGRTECVVCRRVGTEAEVGAAVACEAPAQLTTAVQRALNGAAGPADVAPAIVPPEAVA